MIRDAQAGGREAFSRLVETHYDLMFRCALKYLGVREDAEDVTHQACIKLAGSIGQFRFESAFSSWLYRLVLNCARDFLRKSRPRSEESRASVECRDCSEYCEEDAGEAPGNTAEAQILLVQVMRKIGKMGDGYREAVVLVLGEGLTHGEAAEVLGVRESTVSWRIHEVRKQLDMPGSRV